MTSSNIILFLIACLLPISGCVQPYDDFAGGKEVAGKDLPAEEVHTNERNEDAKLDTGCPGVSDLTGTAFRLTELSMGNPTDTMNSVWEESLATDNLVVLLEVASHDIPGGKLSLRMGPGATTVEDVDGVPTTTELHFAPEPSEFLASLEGCEITFSEPTSLRLVTSAMNKPLSIVGLTGKCTLTDGGKKVSSGYFSGGISETDILDLCLSIPGLGVANLHWYFNLANICPEVDLDEDGTADSYEFSAEFQGETTDLLTPGMVELLVGVEQCEAHNELCGED